MRNDQAPDGSDDRRRHPRITLKAFGLNHVCEVQLDQRVLEARVVDLSPGGARLRMLPGLPIPAQGQKLVLDARFKGIPPEESRRPGIVRWSTGQECGVAFDSDLPFGVTDLQRLLDT